MKIQVGEGYKNTKGTYVHTVTVGDEQFKDVENIPKYKKCSSGNCKHYSECSWKDGVVRRFDCQKNKRRVATIYCTVTGALVAMFFAFLFIQLHLPFFKGIGVLILGMVAFDIVCCIIEDVVPKVRDKRFYKFLKKREVRIEKQRKRQQEAEEAEAATDKFAAMSDSPYYQDVVNADLLVNSLKKLSDEYDFGENDKKIEQCVEKLSKIIEALQNDCSGYARVAFLFESSLNEFFNTLKLYTYFLKSNISSEKNERLLTACVDQFLRYLNNQKIEALLDKSSVDFQFKSSAEALRRMINQKGEN